MNHNFQRPPFAHSSTVTNNTTCSFVTSYTSTAQIMQRPGFVHNSNNGQNRIAGKLPLRCLLGLLLYRAPRFTFSWNCARFMNVSYYICHRTCFSWVSVFFCFASTAGAMWPLFPQWATTHDGSIGYLHFLSWAPMAVYLGALTPMFCFGGVVLMNLISRLASQPLMREDPVHRTQWLWSWTTEMSSVG